MVFLVSYSLFHTYLISPIRQLSGSVVLIFTLPFIKTRHLTKLPISFKGFHKYNSTTTSDIGKLFLRQWRKKNLSPAQINLPLTEQLRRMNESDQVTLIVFPCYTQSYISHGTSYWSGGTYEQPMLFTVLIGPQLCGLPSRLYQRRLRYYYCQNL